MKVFFVALLAACLIQGYHSSPSPLLGSSYVTGALGSVKNIATNTAGAAANLLSSAGSTVTATVPLLTDKEQAEIAALEKSKTVTPEQIKEVDAKVKEQVSSITNVKDQVTEKANSIFKTLSSYVTNVEKDQEAEKEELVQESTAAVKDIVETAADKKVAESCALSSIASMGKTATATTFECMTKKMVTAKDLLLRAKDLPFRAVAIAQAAYAAVNGCKDAYVTQVCQARKMAPVLLDAAKLVGETTLLSAQTLKLGNDLRTDTIPCMKKINELKTKKSLEVRDHTLSCVTSKVSNLVGYNKA